MGIKMGIISPTGIILCVHRPTPANTPIAQ